LIFHGLFASLPLSADIGGKLALLNPWLEGKIILTVQL